jgi:hypothetical protein
MTTMSNSKQILPPVARGKPINAEREVALLPKLCVNCRHWRPITEENPAPLYGIKAPAGHCRGGHPTAAGAVQWPVTPHDECCGDFRPR